MKRALELDPDSSMALNYYAHHEMELGRSRDALARLLGRSSRVRSDPHLLAGLVQACRYCGLPEASIAAYDHVRRLDRVMTTSIAHTFWLKGDYTRVLELLPTSPAPTLAGLSLAALGRESEAIASLEEDETRGPAVAADFCRGVRFALQGRGDEARVIVQRYAASTTFSDPEGVFHIAQIATRVGDHDDAMTALSRSVEHGYCGLPALEVDPWLDPLRGRLDFRRLRDRAEVQRRAAVDTFIVAGGERLLGITVG